MSCVSDEALAVTSERCPLCFERFRPHDCRNELGTCGACARDFARQVQDRSPQTRHLALELLGALVGVLRSRPDSPAANHLSWALHRLGVDGVPSRKALMVTQVDARRGSFTVRLASALPCRDLLAATAAALGLEGERVHHVALDRWPAVVDFAAEQGLAIGLSTICREPTFITDHLVGAPVPDIRGAIGGRVRVAEVRGATLDLELSGSSLDDRALDIVFGPQDIGVFYGSRVVTVSRFDVQQWPGERWVTPIEDARLHLLGLGFRWPSTLPTVDALSALTPEGVRVGAEGRRALLRGLAALGCVDMGLSTTSLVAHSRKHGTLFAVLEPSGRSLLVEAGAQCMTVPASDTVAALSTIAGLL